MNEEAKTPGGQPGAKDGAVSGEAQPKYTREWLLSLPIAKVRFKKSEWSWVIQRCPYCGERHYHGAGEPGENPRRWLGTRVPHCHRLDKVDLSDYILSPEPQLLPGEGAVVLDPEKKKLYWLSEGVAEFLPYQRFMAWGMSVGDAIELADLLGFEFIEVGSADDIPTTGADGDE